MIISVYMKMANRSASLSSLSRRGHLELHVVLRTFFVEGVKMSGVWVFRNGLAKLVQNPTTESLDEYDGEVSAVRPKDLVYRATGEVITHHQQLKEKLKTLGWEIYPDGDQSLIQYHKWDSCDLITLPIDFCCMRTVHMYDILMKNRTDFEVRDAT